MVSFLWQPPEKQREHAASNAHNRPNFAATVNAALSDD
jgi:hypothetical protein